MILQSGTEIVFLKNTISAALGENIKKRLLEIL